MPTTESFPTAVSSNTINADEWFADDNQRNNPIYKQSIGDITLSSFNSLSIIFFASFEE